MESQICSSQLYLLASASRTQQAPSYYFHLHPAELNFRPDDTHTLDKKISLLALILMLAIYWLLNFFGQSIVRGISHTSGFFDMLSVIIVVLIIIRFLS